MGLKNVYISCGCNKTLHAADWGEDGRILFASGNSVALFLSSSSNDASSRIASTCRCHGGTVTSVRWLRDRDRNQINAFISTSADKTAVVGSILENNIVCKKALLQGHENAVTIADGIADDAEGCSLLLVTASVDSTVRVWRKHCNNDITNEDIIKFGSGFALDVRLAALANTTLLACSVDDRKIHLFVANPNGTMTKVHAICGHEDWVQALDFCYHGKKLMLASASQDSFVRVHELTVKSTRAKNTDHSADIPLIETEVTEFRAGDQSVGVRLDTVLTGHENWVYGVSFHRSSSGELRLLTSSMDKTLVVWSLEDSLWIETARVGEVGGNTLGFYGGKFSPDGSCIMAHGYQSSFHIWRSTKDSNWEPQVVAGGHANNVSDLSWCPSGRYLLSVGADQTTRLHAPWRIGSQVKFHEIARPQVHGHDLSCIAAISDTMFVSGAEEKVLRAFQAPANFVENFQRICLLDFPVPEEKLAEGAAVPALGLSNKPVYQNTTADPELYFSPLYLDRPPTEEDLMQNTLWPEKQKLYGHGYEVHCVAASHDALLIASACHATNTEHAQVILWCTRTWNQLQKLEYHRLTVTQLAFSPDDRYLLTVSRDRRWCLHRRLNTESFEIFWSQEKSPHTRIIWCCAWSKDGQMFSTGSRDGVICIWDPDTQSCLAQVNAKDSVTALAFSIVNQQNILLAGTDSGDFIMYKWIAEGGEKKLEEVLSAQEHGGTIRRIQFQPGCDDVFASCSSDHSLRIFQITPETHADW